MKTYAYCRISRRTQNIDRQIRNIKEAYPDAYIFQEAFTGTKIQGRKELDKLLRLVTECDTIVFDSVSRMSRNAEEGFELYQQLFDKGIELVFLKEPHINTATYRKAMLNQVAMTGGNVDFILQGINQYLRALAKEQIRLAFEQAQKEVEDLHTRTSEGLLTAKLNGKRVGNQKGDKLTTQKSLSAKEIIKKHSKDFDGTLEDQDVITLAGISRNSYYKYKKELREGLA